MEFTAGALKGLGRTSQMELASKYQTLVSNSLYWKRLLMLVATCSWSQASLRKEYNILLI